MSVELVVFCLAVGAAVTLFARTLIPREESREETFARRLSAGDAAGGKGAADGGKAEKPTRNPVAAALKRSVPYLARPVLPTNEAEKTRLRTRLARAGLRHESAGMLFLASKTTLGVAVAIIVLLSSWGAHKSGRDLLTWTIGLGGVAFLAPNYWLARRIAMRAIKLRHALSDVLDMMVIMVEAGLGLDAAIQRAGIDMAAAYPELSEEMRVTTYEMNMGLRRAEALENLATRTGLKEIRSLVAAIIQAERFGSGVARTLRVQAATMRVKRRQIAEETAQKVAVKLVFPLIFFILPALVVAIAGPPALSIIEGFRRF